MPKKKQYSVKDISFALRENGWKDGCVRREEEEHYYELTFRVYDEIIVRVAVSEDNKNFETHGCFGVIWLEVKHSAQRFLSRSEVEELESAFEIAERNLLTIGVPFYNDYRFHGSNRANMKRRNLALRRKFDLENAECIAEKANQNR